MVEQRKPGVAFYGKVRYATLGHKKAIDTAKSVADRVGGRLHIGLSGTSDTLTPSQKKSHAEAVFQHPVESGSDHTKNLFNYLSHLNKHHDEIHLVAGSDRAPEYERTLSQWNGKADKSGKVAFNFKKWKVHEVAGKREDSDKHPTKMSRDELEKSASATKVIGLAKSGDYEGFKAYHPDAPEKHVKRVYNQIRAGSQLKEHADIGELNHEKFGPMLDTFTQFAAKKLGIKSMPVMELSKDDLGTSFGGYNPATKSIVISTKNRHPMDVYRTVAHELVHHKQNEDGRLGNDIKQEGATGSEWENEANAHAGMIMRWFAKKNPDAFKTGHIVEAVRASTLQKNKPEPYQPSASEQEQAKRLGIKHVGDGMFGISATHLSKGGQLFMNKLEEARKMKNDPCWKGYQMIGKKNKNGKEVPNCVPVDEAFATFAEENKPSDREWGTDSLTRTYKEGTPGQTTPANPLSEKKKKLKKEDTAPALGYEFGNNGIGPTFGVVRSPNGLGTGYSMPMTSMAESVQKWAAKPSTIERFTKRYGNLAEQKIYDAALKLNEMDFKPRSFTSIREAWEALGGRDMGTVAKQSKEELNERGADSKGLYRSTESGAGLTAKGAKHFGVKTAVTTPPSKLKPGSKATKRRKSFCARMGGMKGPMKDEKGRPTRKAMSLRRWNCEE